MIQVGIFFGGPSAEHTVSCASALSVVRALPRERFEPVVIGITAETTFRLVPDEVIEALRNPPPGVRAIDDRLEVTGPAIELRSLRPESGAIAVSAETGEQLARIDVAFPLLHGPFGEDGVLQGFLETLGVPYAGNGVGASAVGMDKVAMKRAFQAEGLPMTPHVHFHQAQWQAAQDPLALVEKLERPLFVKPANMGSSLGMSRVTEDSEFIPAVDEALCYDDAVVIEQGVTGREIECSVLGGYHPQASPVGEVTVTGGWFDYQQKYFATEDPMIVPADLPGPVAAEVRELSVRAFQAIGCWGLARVDFLYDEAAGVVYLNELNTLPGFTAHSMYPKLWAEAGVPYPELVTRLIDLGLERHAVRRRLRVSPPTPPE